LKYVDEYNEIQKRFFNSCDECFKHIKINDDLVFAPFHIMPFEFALIFDSLFSQTQIILEILRKFNPEEVILLTSYKPTNKNINYIRRKILNYYEYLNYEIINHLSFHFNYIFKIQIVNSNRIEELKYWAKIKLKSTKIFNLYSQIKKLSNDYNKIENNSFNYMKGKNVLFTNQAWGLNKLLGYVLNINHTTSVLENDFLFKYEGTILKKVLKLKYSDKWDHNQFHTDFHESFRIISCFVQDNLGVFLDNLIQRRLSYINKNIVPSLFNKCITIDDILNELKIDYVIGNMKYDDWRYILAYIGTYKKNCEFIYFTHGYNMYDVDRTFLELPCNIYYTMNDEFADHIRSQSIKQIFYIKPKEIMVNSEIL
jgi:hypothetical protein